MHFNVLSYLYLNKKYTSPLLLLVMIINFIDISIVKADVFKQDLSVGTRSSECENGIVTDGLTLYVVDPISNIPILPDTNLSDLNSKGCAIDVNSARGEYEPASFIIRSNETINSGVEVFASPLVNENGVILKDSIEIKSVKVWYQAAEAWSEIARVKSAKSNKVRLVPELLVNDEKLINVDKRNKINHLRVEYDKGVEYLPKGSKVQHRKSIINLSPGYNVADASLLQKISIEKNSNKQMWLTFHVPVETKAGLYKGTLTVLNNNIKLAETPINLNVLPYELPEPKLEYGMYYHGRLHESGNESISSEYKSVVQLRTELLDMYKHGIKNPIIYQHHYKSEKNFKKYMSIRNELGIDNKVLYFMWLNTEKVGTDDDIRRIKKDILYIKSLVKEYGTKEIYVYGRDEAKGLKLIEQRKAWDSIRSDNVKVYVAGYKGTFEAIGKSLDLFVLAKSPMQEEANKFHKINHKIFNYANPQSGIENPYIYRRNYGVVLWSSGFDGAMIYAYQHSMGDAWNDSDHYLFRDHNFTYPTSNGVVKTIAWEGLREGIDDVRYLTLLEYEISKYSNSSNKEVLLLIAEVDKYLEYLKHETSKYNKAGRYTDNFYIDLSAVRLKVSDYIMKLNSIVK